MVGIRLIIVMAVVGGLIAYIADKMGSKIGKKRLSIFGLRPKYTSILLTVLSGIMISVLTIGVMAVASQSARTALFGMEQLQKELLLLNEERTAVGAELEDAKKKVGEQNETISKLDEKIKESLRENDEIEAKLSQANENYRQAQNEVDSLTKARSELSNEVKDLENLTEQLRKGIISIREGQVFYRTGEVIYAGIMHGGLTHEENEAQVNWLLQNANEAALQRLGIERSKDEPLQAIWINRHNVENAITVLDTNKGNMLFRVRAVANVIVGELAVCDIEITENQFIYSDGSLIYSEEYNLEGQAGGWENVIMSFLNKVNHEAVRAGVLPDPMTGKVGSLDAGAVIEASSAMRNSGGHFILRAYARGDITTAGPVRVRLKVEAVE